MTRRARVVVADPPWPFRDKLPGCGRGAAKHYGLLSLADLCTFALPPIADDAVLFLWRVGSMQREALAVARAWGFGEPTSEIVWVKTAWAPFPRPRMGMGRTVRNAHEVALLCKRGRPERLSASVPSVLLARRHGLRHSEKPDEFFAMVEKLYAGPRVELFGRKPRAGWTVLGDEAIGTVKE